jgi:2-polyprenyl-3-methyl-5-hydroxy-6-metoxy-1,4-benzoquinol methylase
MKSHEIQLLLSESNKDWVLANPGTVSPRIVKARQIFSRMNPGQVILDVGCADGGILKPLVGPHEIHGVEITPWLVELALKNGVKAVRHNIEAEPLPYANARFDAVFCGETIEHQVDTDWLMFEINRVLKPGGKLVLTFPNIRTLLGLAMMLFFDLPPMYAARYRSAHFRDFTLRLIKVVLAAHGFRVERTQGSAFYLPKLNEFWSPVATYFPSWSHTVIVEAVKESESVYSKESVLPVRLY